MKNTAWGGGGTAPRLNPSFGQGETGEFSKKNLTADSGFNTTVKDTVTLGGGKEEGGESRGGRDGEGKNSVNWCIVHSEKTVETEGEKGLPF